jgi:GntR family transcriptional regulator
MTDIPVRSSSLTDQVFSVLMDRITGEVYPAGGKLPPENELADEFKVSRSTIRTAINKLEDRKLVHRKPGVGTYINENTKITNPLNEFIEFSKLIRANGFSPGYLHISSELLIPSEAVRKDLQLEKDQTVLKIKKVFTANQDPIIFVTNHIPEWVIRGKVAKKELLSPQLTKDFRRFFEGICNQQVSYFISQVRADIFGNISAPEVMKEYQDNTPTLIIDQIGFNREDKPIISTKEYHPGNWMTFNLIRRWG